MSRPSETPQKNVGKSCGSRSPDVDIVRLFLVKNVWWNRQGDDCQTRPNPAGSIFSLREKRGATKIVY